MFKDIGVDCVVRGGQTMNPSTEDILAAICATPAKTVFVLPNNKNIIMAAEQAVKLADRKVCVLQALWANRTNSRRVPPLEVRGADTRSAAA